MPTDERRNRVVAPSEVEIVSPSTPLSKMAVRLKVSYAAVGEGEIDDDLISQVVDAVSLEYAAPHSRLAVPGWSGRVGKGRGHQTLPRLTACRAGQGSRVWMKVAGGAVVPMSANAKDAVASRQQDLAVWPPSIVPAEAIAAVQAQWSHPCRPTRRTRR